MSKFVTFRKQLITDTFVVPHTNRKPFPKRISRRRRAKMEAAAQAEEVNAEQAWDILILKEHQDTIIDLANSDEVIMTYICKILNKCELVNLPDLYHAENLLTEYHMNNFYATYAGDRAEPMPVRARVFLTLLRSCERFVEEFFTPTVPRNVSESPSSASDGDFSSNDSSSLSTAGSNGSGSDNDNDDSQQSSATESN